MSWVNPNLQVSIQQCCFWILDADLLENKVSTVIPTPTCLVAQSSPHAGNTGISINRDLWDTRQNGRLVLNENIVI